MGVAHIVSVKGPLATDITNLGHEKSSYILHIGYSVVECLQFGNGEIVPQHFGLINKTQ